MSCFQSGFKHGKHMYFCPVGQAQSWPNPLAHCILVFHLHMGVQVFSIIPLFPFTVFVYDAQIQNGQPIVSYHIQYFTFLGVKSASLPCPWRVPVVFMPYLGIIGFCTIPSTESVQVLGRVVETFIFLYFTYTKDRKEEGTKTLSPTLQFFSTCIPLFFQLLSKVLHHICGRNFSFKKLY